MEENRKKLTNSNTAMLSCCSS